MSYCRWSSMNWQCDVYVYENVSGGWTTHVAGRRRPIQPIPDISFHRAVRWLGAEWSRDSRKVIYPSRWKAILARILFGFAGFWHNRIHMASLHLIPMRPIGLSYDGANFNDGDPGECADRIESLRVIGYIVPQYAIDALREEQTALQSPPAHKEKSE